MSEAMLKDRHDFDRWLRGTPRRCLVMGILNVTPDSFSDGGRFLGRDQSVEHALEMIEAGADLLDIGGESTRPGSEGVPAGEQIRRVVPVIETIRKRSPIPISVDTTCAAVAAAALDAGADMVNDIAAGLGDPAMLPLVAQRGVAVVLMHMKGTPRTMQQSPHYDDVVAEVLQFLTDRVQAAVDAGVRRDRILIDPGIGFGKSLEHNLELLRQIAALAGIGQPLLVGTSRKGFIGTITGQPVAADRTWGTAATVAWAVAGGSAIVRVHDVKPTVQVVRMIEAIQQRHR